MVTNTISDGFKVKLLCIKIVGLSFYQFEFGNSQRQSITSGCEIREQIVFNNAFG
jgi:hypothetical protein